MERPAPIRSSWVTLRVGALHNAERFSLACRSRVDATPAIGRRGRPLRAQTQHVNRLSERTLASPPPVDGRWCIRTAGHLLAIGRK